MVNVCYWHFSGVSLDSTITAAIERTADTSFDFAPNVPTERMYSVGVFAMSRCPIEGENALAPCAAKIEAGAH